MRKAELKNLPEWRFRQAADALRLFFKELISPQWAA